ncbi:MAG TPA: efflux RND transporter periplasmic adaptor subunit [Pyrinomonadaceae bacterium]|jgi:cobalt-zinc-cadmium efflux system membrane fusion protein|nr:efflux RND transporter periplasmic adaptor subunit [Pyrinomonadaceae bacterium]
MVYRKITQALSLLPLLAVLIFQGCNRATNAPSNVASPSPGAAAATAASAHAIEMEIVAPQPIAGTIVATGKILVPEDRTANIGPVHEGRIVRFYAGQGSIVRKGQKLADLESADIDQAEADYLKALADYENARRTSAAEVKFAQATYDRTKMLYEKSITAGKNVEAADHDLEMAKASAASTVAQTNAALTSARRHLLILGLKDSDINALANKSSLSAVFSLTSPISGVVVERTGTIGATVGSDANVFKIIDISRVWIDANVFEKDLERVKRGQVVKASVPAFPGVSFSGSVILISSVVDPEGRSVKVRTELSNSDGRLKPDMFANVQIITDLHRTAISIPEAAVLDDGGKSVVFIAAGNGYAKREVHAGIEGNGRVEIIEGLQAGDKVVVKGNYLLLEQSKAQQ